MENHKEKTMEHEMETGVREGVKEQNSSHYIGETLLVTVYTHYGNPKTQYALYIPIMVT